MRKPVVVLLLSTRALLHSGIYSLALTIIIPAFRVGTNSDDLIPLVQLSEPRWCIIASGYCFYVLRVAKRIGFGKQLVTTRVHI